MRTADAPTSASPSEANPQADLSIDELRRQVAELTEAVKARDAFIAIAAHELRNPMTPIRAQLDLLLRLLRSGRSSPERIEAGLDRVNWLVEQYIKRATTLLDISRVTSGKLTLEPTSVHLATLVRETVNGLSPLALHAGSVISVDVSDAITGAWDQLAVEQIVDNLVSNAIKYGAGKPIDVAAEADEDRVTIRVRDRGIGISDLDRARIFERFERAVGRGEHGGGFGVGLWIVRQLVEAMGGEIAVDNNNGEGTTFSVTLPIQAKGPR